MGQALLILSSPIHNRLIENEKTDSCQHRENYWNTASAHLWATQDIFKTAHRKGIDTLDTRQPWQEIFIQPRPSGFRCRIRHWRTFHAFHAKAGHWAMALKMSVSFADGAVRDFVLRQALAGCWRVHVVVLFITGNKFLRLLFFWFRLIPFVTQLQKRFLKRDW